MVVAVVVVVVVVVASILSLVVVVVVVVVGLWHFSARLRRGFVVSANLRETRWSFHMGKWQTPQIPAIQSKASAANTQNNVKILARESPGSQTNNIKSRLAEFPTTTTTTTTTILLLLLQIITIIIVVMMIISSQNFPGPPQLKAGYASRVLSTCYHHVSVY